MVRIRTDNDEKLLSWEEWEHWVRSGRVPPDALVQIEAVTGEAFVPAQDLELYRSLRNDERLAWRYQFTSGQAPILSALLVGVQVRLWWFAFVPVFLLTYRQYLTNWAPAIYEDGQVWRLVTMGFLHEDPGHLLANMVFLAYTSWSLERALGRINVLVIYLSAVVTGSLASMYFSPEVQSLGASGGVFGLMAAVTVFGFIRADILPDRGRRLFGWAMLPYLLLMYYSGWQGENVDNWAHTGGLVAGGLLGFLLDPVPLQRRPGWNSAWQVGIFATIGTVMAGLYALGPHVAPLVDAVDATSALAAVETETKDREDRTLVWSVPETWIYGTASDGTFGFKSRLPETRRVWAVVESHRTEPDSAAKRAEAWGVALSSVFPNATLQAPRPTKISGLSGLEVQAVLPNPPERTITYRVATRGLWTLEEVWEVESESASGLAPLRDRLRAQITWLEPSSAVDARLSYERNPDTVRSQRRLATALADIGESKRSLELWQGLVEAHPEDPSHWIGLLQTLQWYPEQAGEEALLASCRTAMEQHPTPDLWVAVAEVLEQAGHTSDAEGLLDLGWIQRPGDRVLARARRARGLPVRLDADQHLPWTVVFDPSTGDRRSDKDIEAIRRVSVDLTSAKQHGAALVARRRALLDAALLQAVTNPTDSLRPFLVLKYGYIPPSDPEVLDGAMGLAEDLRTLQEGGEVPWLSKELASRVQATLETTPDLAEQIGALAPAPVP